MMQAPKPANRWLRAAKLLGGGVIFLVLAYLALLVPEPRGPVARGAGKQPFIWKQDPFWFELERQFNQARAEGCQTLLTRIDADLDAVQRLVGQCSGNYLPPEAPVFADLESGLFRLAPLVAACPQRLTDYIALATPARSELRIQSQHCDLNAASPRQRLYRLCLAPAWRSRKSCCRRRHPLK